MANNESDSSNDMMDVDHFISATLSSDTFRIVPPDVFPSKNLRDAIRFILNNNINRRNNETLTEHQEEIFEIIEQLRVSPQKMFMYLRKNFAKEFDIDLYIIAFGNEKFSLIKENNYKKENMAFLLFNEDNTVRGPLYTISKNGTCETVFSILHNFDIHMDVYFYIAQLNDTKESDDFPQMQEQQAVSCMQESIDNSLNDNNSVPINQLNPSDATVHVDEKTQSHALNEQMSQQICRLFDSLSISPNTTNLAFEPFLSHIATLEHSSPEHTILALKNGINCFLRLIQIVEPLIPINQNDQIGTPHSNQIHNQNTDLQNEINPPLTDTPHSNQIHNQNTDLQNEINPPLVNVDISLETSLPNHTPTTEQTIKYGPPEISKPLKSTIHPRTLKEFATTGSSPIQCVNSNQREPLHIKVPPDDKNSLYLGIGIVTVVDHQIHPSKIIVPDKTKANDESLINNNDLRCLNCNGCHVDDKLDLDNKHIYSKISSTERQASQKDIRIHMLNLYQRGQINRTRVRDQDLKKCKLALWFCILEDGIFKYVSPVSYSNIIADYMKVTNTAKKAVIK